MSEPVEKAPAVGVSVAIDLGGNRTMTIQSHFAQEDGLAGGNKVVDLLTMIAERQRAKIDVVEIGKKIADHRRVLANLNEDFGRIDAEALTKVKALADAMFKAKEDAEAVLQDDFKAFRAAGKQGDYRASAQAKANHARSEQAFTSAESDWRVAMSEREAALKNHEVTVTRYNQEIEKLIEELDQRRSIAEEFAQAAE